MGFWNKLGKIALQVAPYVAAPFTGGASLAFAPAARQAGQKWAEHDAREAAKKGLAPSRFDRYLDMGSGMAGAAGGMGAFGEGNFSAANFNEGNDFGASRMMGGIGGSRGQQRYPMDERYGTSSGGTGNYQAMLDQVLNRRGGGDSGGYSRQGAGGYSYGRGDETTGNNGMSRFSMRMRRQLGPVMGAEDQSNPNLAMSIGAGRMDAIRNQPFRGGYTVVSQGPEPADDSQGNVGPDVYSQMPPIYPNGQRRRNPYGNELGGGEDYY